MTKVFKNLLIVTMSLSLIFGFTTSISAESSTQQEIFSTKVVDKTIISSSPNVPDFIAFDDYITLVANIIGGFYITKAKLITQMLVI